MMTRRQSGSRRKLAKATQPPPIPYMPAQSKQAESALPNQVLFTDGLIRFLIVNLSLLTVLLAANVFVVLRADSIQGNPGPAIAAGDAKPSQQELTQPQNADATGFAAGDSLPAQPVTIDSSLLAFGGTDRQRPLTMLDLPIEFVSTAQPVRRTVQPVQNVVDAQVNSTPEVDSVEDEEVLLITELWTERQRLAAEQIDTSFQPASPQTCGPPKNLDANLTQAPIDAPFYGTKIEWYRRVDEAARLAKSENKLVYLIHVSGNFTKEEFT